MYAFHWYVPPANANLDLYLEERMADAKRLKAAPYASEWNFGASSPEDAASFFGTFGRLRYVCSSRHGQYCSSQPLQQQARTVL